MIHTEHTSHRKSQPSDIAAKVPSVAQPFIDGKGELVIEVLEILLHRRRGRGNQFLTLFSGAPAHEAEWKTLRDFIGDDGTVTKALHDYITSKVFLPELH